MLTMNYRYLLLPDATREQQLIEWMEICRGAFSCGLRSTQDRRASGKSATDKCSLGKECILPADWKFPGAVERLNNLPKVREEFPNFSDAPSQVWQQTIERIHRDWEYFCTQGLGFPRFKQSGQFKSLLLIDVDVGLEKFLTTSDGILVRSHIFFKTGNNQDISGGILRNPGYNRQISPGSASLKQSDRTASDHRRAVHEFPRKS